MDPWDGAEQYPQDRVFQHSFHGDLNYYRKRLAEDEDLCLQECDDDLELLRDNPVIIIDIPKHESNPQRQTETSFANAENNELTKCLRNFRDPARHSRVIVIQPSMPDVWAWCQIGITVDMLRQVLTTYQVMPGFLDYLHMFGQTLGDRDNFFGGGRHELHFAEESGLLDQYETCYTLNYVVQERQDDNPWNLWGIRRIAVYQKFSYDDQSSTWILLHPSERIRQWVQESLQAQSERTSVSCAQKALETHMAFFSNSAENWRTYYKFLERYLIEKTACAYICDVSTPEMAATATKQVWGVKFQDLQNLHKFEEKLYELQRSLDTNSEAIHALVRLNNDIRDFGSASEKDGKYWYRVNHALEQYRHEIGLQQRNIDNFLKRISGRSQLLCNITELHTTTSLHIEMREMSQQNSTVSTTLNTEMRDMTKQTIKDTISMKIITLVAMIYLPITFIATFLNSGITTFQHNDFIELKSDALALKGRMSFSREAFAMFIFLSVPLLIITLLGWVLFEKRIQKQLNEKTKAKEKSTEIV